MSENKNIHDPTDTEPPIGVSDPSIAVPSSDVSSIAGSVKTSTTHTRVSSTAERKIKFERAQKCLENAALVSKRIKEHRKATAELLGKPFEEDELDTASEMATTISERTGYSAATDTSTTLSVQDALNIPGISESLANTLKQKELLMERIKQYKQISKRPIVKSSPSSRKESVGEFKFDDKLKSDNSNLATLQNTIKDKENALSIMQVKIKAMETTIMDLQEKINEKDQIIEAKNKATTLISDSLSKKERDSLILLEDTKQQMIKIQENFSNMEADWKEEKDRLFKEIKAKDEKINYLVEANEILEKSRLELSITQARLEEEIVKKDNDILELQTKLQAMAQEHTQLHKNDGNEEEKGSREIACMAELTKKIELLEQLNCQIRQTNKELENKLAKITLDTKSVAGSSPSKKASPLPTRKGSRNTSKLKSPWSSMSSEQLQDTETKSNKNEPGKLEILVQSLNKDILDKEYVISQKNAIINELQLKIAETETNLNDLKSIVSSKKEDIEIVDISVGTENILDICDNKADNSISLEEKQISDLSVSDLEQKLTAAQNQIATLNEEIDAANKSMIKVKSSHKLKIKQMQKTIDNFSKMSDANAEIIRLNEELHQLSQKVAELEEEKGNLQLHLVDYDSGRLTESDVYRKMIETENLAEARLKSISVLEAQKFDLVQELHTLQQKYNEMEDRLADISHIESEQVSSEIKSVQLEEQIDKLIASKKELEHVNDVLKMDNERLSGLIRLLEEEKEEFNQKLQHYVQENIELTDKLEKLSAEKVSSAESIEIVESLTVQEKLELEEYNKEMSGNKNEADNGDDAIPLSRECNENIEKIVEESAELNRKIELFTQERQEVMEKMNKINTENEALQEHISRLNDEVSILQNNILILNTEKQEFQALNEELVLQIENLKRERIEILKESSEVPKPVVFDEFVDVSNNEAQQEEKLPGDKRTKSVKQLTKEILKLKNTIKERENEIADCQMKILSLEEQHQKQSELIQNTATLESKIKCLLDENSHLKEELDNLNKEKENYQQTTKIEEANELLQKEILRIQQEYLISLQTRDSKIQELENLLLEYEKQIFNYNNTVQQKDKELVEYINQITKLNDVSQKLKSTIELLEEEKAKDQNAEMVKSLNKQIAAYQKKLNDCEEQIRALEDEKAQLLSLKAVLETKNVNLETELKKSQETLAEKQTILKELQALQQKHDEEMSAVILQAKERDEEIHEIKLQLRKESIENEKLRTNLLEKKDVSEQFTRDFDEAKEMLVKITAEKNVLNEQCTTMEIKNKELLEKLKKFAISIKKKTSMYTELENHLHEIEKQLETKNEQLEQLAIQVEVIPALHEKLKYAEGELNRLQSQKMLLEQQKSYDTNQWQAEITSLKNNLAVSTDEAIRLEKSLETKQEELRMARDENFMLKSQIDILNNKLVDHEVEQKNNINFTTKISTLESDINQKQKHISDLLSKLADQEQQSNQLQFGHNAEVQKRDLYIESLESEISKFKNRICRLEESISVMEDRRYSLERKADHLDSQLQEKQKAYNEYRNQEDELVNRLAVLMDHDRVVEKQLHEIESENKELQLKIQHLNTENLRLKKSLSDIQDHCNTLEEKASKTDTIEFEIVKYQTQIHELDANLKRTTNEYQTLLSKNKQDIEELESEFNMQIENAIKEKKSLAEKYEKTNEHVAQLEMKLVEYSSNMQNLRINHEELTRINQDLMEKSAREDQNQPPDYTEQYISEINKLNALAQSKTEEINVLKNKIKMIESNNETVLSDNKAKVEEVNKNLQLVTAESTKFIEEIDGLKDKNGQLVTLLAEKEEQIKQLKEKKKLTFEMNIPKTEGMVISSTIESLSAEPQEYDISSIESQIITNVAPNIRVEPVAVKVNHSKQHSSIKKEDILEPVVECKKAYLCYDKEESDNKEMDPFNSEDGWGFEEQIETGEVTPGLSHLNSQIRELQKINQSLKIDYDACNTKLMKVMKKLKELKASNEMLSNELKISKQLSQSSFLDVAIEEELKITIQELEKKIIDLNSDLAKEKKEKDALRKQNEIFNNANDRLTEIKEKLDNEIELWKYKFKEANDKAQSLQWKEEPQESSPSVKYSQVLNVESNQDEIAKLEKENDELQAVVDQITSHNKELGTRESQLKNELENLTKQLQHLQGACENCGVLNKQLLELKEVNTAFCKEIEELNKKVKSLDTCYKETVQKYDQLKVDNNSLIEDLKQNTDINEENNRLKTEIQTLQTESIHTNATMSNLVSELEALKSKSLLYEKQHIMNTSLDVNSFALSEKCNIMEDNCQKLKLSLEDANNKIALLESENKDFTQKSKVYDQQILELNNKIQNLNSENDQLLSTVAELRSSVASAVDQRGFEIAELWKQHLAQREADFQKTEQELRAHLHASEVKYEQLLDNVQSSSQEETNKLVVMEQVNSLQNKLQDKEEHLRDMQDKHAEIINQLDMLRSEMEDEKIMHENKLLAQQEEYEKQIQELTEKHQEHADECDKLFKNLQSELTTVKANNEELNLTVEELQHNLKEDADRVVDLTNQLKIKDIEIHQKTQEYNIILTQRNEEFENVRKQLLEYEKKVEELAYEKESELAILRLKMHDNGEHYERIQNEYKEDKKILTEALNEKIMECTNLSKQITELKHMLDEQTNKMAEMQSVLETQEMEIVTLKDEILSLQNELKLASSKIEKHVTFASSTKLGPDDETPLNKGLLDAVPRAELDLALYMLHQRDVRCEELTMELTQLLEERDTLQLRLSDSLRSYEELKSRCSSSGIDISTYASQDTVAELPSFATEKDQLIDVHRAQTSRNSSISEAEGEKPKLQAKLTELRTVKQNRDVRLRHESEQRQLDLRLLHRDVAQLPPEAVDQLTQAHHTLSRDSQSTSTVLLNWLRGKSTPKVVHM